MVGEAGKRKLNCDASLRRQAQKYLLWEKNIISFIKKNYKKSTVQKTSQRNLKLQLLCAMRSSARYVQGFITLHTLGKGHCYFQTAVLFVLVQFSRRNSLLRSMMIPVPRAFRHSHYGLNHAFLRHIMLGKKGGNDDRKDDSPWCCSPVLTAPKLGKRSYLTFSTAISTARRHGSSGACDVANRLSPLKVRRHFRQGSMCSQICRGRR
jgi:hypothetical protein